MSQTNAVTALLGGAFDPIHHGHLGIAKAVLELTPVNQLQFIPCFQNVHKKPPIASSEHRLAMVTLAIQDIPSASIQHYELEQARPVYMVETLQHLVKASPEQHFCLVLGMDAYAHFHTWQDWQGILELCHLIVFNRPGEAAASLMPERFQSDLSIMQSSASGSVFHINMDSSVDISSTSIRNHYKSGQNPSLSLPKAVHDYILHHQLYGSQRLCQQAI